MELVTSISSEKGRSNSRTLPQCSRCANHGIKILLKGHKRYCKNRNCPCPKCIITKVRQKVMAVQVAQKRAQEQDERRRNDLAAGEQVYPENGGKILPPHLTRILQGGFFEELLQCSTFLLSNLQYPYASLPLIYLILKYAGADVEEAAKRIEEARTEICMIDYEKRRLMAEYAWKCCYLGPSPTPGPTGGAPTYEGSIPYVGVVPPWNSFHLSPHPDSMSAYTTEPSSTPVSSPEDIST